MKLLKSIRKFADTDRIAVKHLDEELSYKNLEIYSDRIANYFLKEFNKDKTPIVIYGDKQNEIIPIMIGALKSGHAYVPIDISFPQNRVNQIISEIRPKVVFNCTSNDLNLDSDVLEIGLDNIRKIFTFEGKLELTEENWVKNDDNCYILFTSGSTGKPKGVQISKKNLDSFIDWFGEEIKINGQEGKMLNQAAYSFDLSVVSLYLALCNGKTLFSLDKETLKDFGKLFEELKKSEIEYWVSTPTLADICTRFDDFNGQHIKNISKFIFIGEILTKNTAKNLLDRFTNSYVINAYGPTEATVAITSNYITKDMIEEEKELSIGFPMKNCVLRIVDESGNVLNDGEKGEIIVIGNSVSKGYFDNEEITKKAFFISESGQRGYRTGDLAYYENDRLYYCGRKDFQIKLNGFRIEIEDIENNFRKLDNINNVAVLPVKNNEQKISHLSAFVVLNNDNGLSNLKNSKLIKAELSKFIPSYMIPRNIKVLKQFPLNTNGKIDKKRLMEELL